MRPLAAAASRALCREISDLAKSIVRKWKEAVEESKKRKADSQDGSDDGGGAKKKVKADSSRPSEASPPPSAAPARAKGPSSPAPSIVAPFPAKPRTFASDKAPNAGTGDSIRDKSVELIYTALAGDSLADRAVLLEKAKLVEKGFFNAVGTKTNDAYRGKIRGVILNLKEKTNSALRDGIVRGEISAVDVCNMSKEVRLARPRGALCSTTVVDPPRAGLPPFPAGHGEREPAGA